jgi:hypothetical protein
MKPGLLVRCGMGAGNGGGRVLAFTAGLGSVDGHLSGVVVAPWQLLRAVSPAVAGVPAWQGR